jgi:toxin CcdB
MPRFDVYKNPDRSEQSEVPFYLDVQNSFVEVDTRVVLPVVALSYLRHTTQDLNPELTILGKSYVLNTSAIGAIPLNELRRPVENIANQQILIQQALDTLFGSY